MGGNAVYLTRNKKCIFNLAKKNFGKSKTRNIITILAIILTTMLFTSMLTICTGTYQSIQTTMQMQKGSKADGDIRYLTKNEFEQLQENSNIKVSGCRRPIGFASNTKNHNVEIDYMDQIEQELTFNRPTHGKAPQKANEIATTDKALESLGVTPKVGEKVRIEFDLRGEHYVYEMTVSGWWEARNSQVSVLIVSEEFMNKNESLFPYTYDEDMEYAGTYFSEVIFESKKNVEQQINEIIEGFNEQKGKDVVSGAVNSITNPQLDFSVIGAVIIFIVLFILAGYLLINNIYSISAMQDIKNYGLLKTIGTTQSQIALLVKIQTLWLLVLGIPIGLVTGYFIGKFILPFAVNTIASEYLRTEIVIAPNPLIFVVATIFTIVTVKISIGKPLRTISKISPLVAIRETGIRKNKKKKKTHKFSIIKMANDNFRRNKKRSIFIVISIALCCVFFNSVFILANSISIEKGVGLQSAADIEIGSGNLFNNLKGYTRHSDGLEPQVIDSIKANFKINEEGIIYKNTLDDLNVTFDYNAPIQDEIVSENGVKMVATESGRIILGNNNFPICNVYGIDENVYQRMNLVDSIAGIEQNSIFQKMEQENFLIEALPVSRTSKDTRKFQCNLGDKIKVFVDGEEKLYTVIAYAYVSPTEYEAPNMTTGINIVGGDAPMFYLSQQSFVDLYQNPTIMNYTFNVDKENMKQISLEIEAFVEEFEGKVGFNSAELIKQDMESMKNTIYAVGIVVSCIIGISGLINFLNLTIANILSRRREFAIMESVGMSKKQIKVLITGESLLYSVYAALLGLACSLVSGFLLIGSICEDTWFMHFDMVIWPAILIGGVIVILTIFLPKLLYKVFSKGSIVEKLRIEG